jgi:hypothetical protein
MDIQKEWDSFVEYLRTKGVVKIGRNALGVITNLVREGSCSLGYNDIELMWETWQDKAQAVQEGFVLVEKSKVRTWYQDEDEPENFCNSESDLDCLGDCLDDDDIIVVNIHESAHISTRKVFGVWKSNSSTDIQSKFVLVDSREEAEEIVAANKAMIEAQEQN